MFGIDLYDLAVGTVEHAVAVLDSDAGADHQPRGRRRKRRAVLQRVDRMEKVFDLLVGEALLGIG